MAKKRFAYMRWARNVAADCLDSDLACGFEIADDTPDGEKAREAMRKLISQLKKEQ